MISIEQEANQLMISLLFGYEQVAKRIANIRLTLFIWNVFLRLYKLFLQI